MIMWKEFSNSTNMLWLDKDYDMEKMSRYWSIIWSIKIDNMIDNTDLCIAGQEYERLLELEVQKLMRKWISIPAPKK